MKYTMQHSSKFGFCELKDDKIIYLAERDCEEIFFNFDISFPEWEKDCYMMMPACVYNGNRFKKVERKYPPMYRVEETGVDGEPMITNVPALNPDGSGKIEVTSGDMAVPCVGIYNRIKEQSFFLFTEQEIKGKNIGFTVEQGKISISYPANRKLTYRMCRLEKCCDDKGISVKKGEKLCSSYRIYTASCHSMAEFYKQFFKLRKAVMHDKRAGFLYTKELWDIMEKHFNEKCFSGEYYAEMSKKWQCGWVGGGMSTYPLLKYGSKLSKERASQTIDYMTNKQAPSGFYYGIVENGIIKDDSFGAEGMQNLHLVRKSGDALYFLFKNFTAVHPKQKWIESAKKCSDAFVTLFKEYDTFGQFVNVLTGELVVGSSFAGAIVPAALVKAWKFFGENQYLLTARTAVSYYMELFLKTGVTNGAPGEILCAPDSESAFALLESCVVLYEEDKNPKWLSYAKTMAHYASSWVVTYAYKFPPESEFGRLNINTVGSVFANIQNKHSAPGICTLSGDSLLKLYRYTDDLKYLELIKDIAYFIPQCVSMPERPIYSWDNPPEKLPEGYICERVNMSDWESKACVGGVFCVSGWPETSLMLSFSELMGHEEMRETDSP